MSRRYTTCGFEDNSSQFTPQLFSRDVILRIPELGKEIVRSVTYRILFVIAQSSVLENMAERTYIVAQHEGVLCLFG